MRLARHVGAEIVSCDSLQVYRGLDIGSAKPTAADRAEIVHHLIDVVDPDESFSAADYARRARAALVAIVGRGRVPLVVGGTGLYLRALLEGFFPGPSRDEALRARLTTLAERHGDQRLARLLAHVDPTAAARIPVRDRVRTIRALEVYFLTGVALSRQQSGREDPLRGFDVRLVGLALPRALLAQRIRQRTEQMLAEGLLDEVRALLARGYRTDLRPLRAIGYREAVAVIEGRLPPGQAAGAITQATMRYAKRQMTWFRHQAQVEWCSDEDSAFVAACACLGSPGRPPAK
jgi:tRNA dimethylallyltransferase